MPRTGQHPVRTTMAGSAWAWVPAIMAAGIWSLLLGHQWGLGVPLVGIMLAFVTPNWVHASRLHLRSFRTVTYWDAFAHANDIAAAAGARTTPAQLATAASTTKRTQALREQFDRLAVDIAATDGHLQEAHPKLLPNMSAALVLRQGALTDAQLAADLLGMDALEAAQLCELQIGQGW